MHPVIHWLCAWVLPLADVRSYSYQIIPALESTTSCIIASKLCSCNAFTFLIGQKYPHISLMGFLCSC